MWVILTAVSNLFTFCPPAPDERKVSILKSLGLIFKSLLIISGKTSIKANEVWRNPLAENGEILTRRWTPDSPFKVLYVFSPVISQTAFLMPFCSPKDWLRTVNPQPLFWAYRWYILKSIDAQSWASMPPAPEYTYKRALFFS